MTKLFILRTALLFFIYLCIGFPAKSQAFDPMIHGRDSFERAVQQMMKVVGVPGLSLAVINDNKVVYYHNFGYKQRATHEPVDEQTVFEAASLSKTYLVYTAFKLVEQGKLDLDKPINEYLDYPALKNDPRFKLITSRQILSHCSGIENWPWNNDKNKLEIVSRPGEKFVYSGTAYNYLADVIAKILGEPYESYTQRLVIDELGLKNSYLKFDKASDGKPAKPINYASGHDPFGETLQKWRNSQPVPSSAINATAQDYANLLLAFFDQRHFNRKTLQTILTPVVKIGKEQSSYYGTGFELHFVNGDTIVAHAGDNTGFKAEAYYSLRHKRGFVFLSNSERGKLMTSFMSALATGLNINEIYKDVSLDQYPGSSVYLFRTYMDQGAAAMFNQLHGFEQENKISERTFYSIGSDLVEKDDQAAQLLLEEGIRRYPRDPNTYVFLGDVFLRRKAYMPAYAYYSMAKSLGFSWWSIDSKMASCQEAIVDEIKRKTNLLTVKKVGETKLTGVEYNAMVGVDVGMTPDSGEQSMIVFLDDKDQVDYNLAVEATATYDLAFRVSSVQGEGVLQLFANGQRLKDLQIPKTGAWKNWTTITARVKLKQGKTLFRLASASSANHGFDIHWIKFLSAPQ